jgi:hypothetical protein
VPDRTVVVAEFPLAGTIAETRRGIPGGFSHGAWGAPNPHLEGYADGIQAAIRWSHYTLAGGGGVALLDRGLPGRELVGSTPVVFLLNAQDTYLGFPCAWLSGKGEQRGSFALLAHEEGWDGVGVPALSAAVVRGYSRRKEEGGTMATVRSMCLGLAALAAAATGAAADRGSAPAAKDYAGAWDVLIVNSGDTFKSCSLRLDEREGGLLGEMVWRWGSVWQIKDPAIATVNDQGDLCIRRNDWATPLTFKRIGSMLEGAVQQKDGPSFYLIGLPAGPELDVTGLWDATLSRGDQELRGVLKVEEQAPGRLTGRVLFPDGEENRDTRIEDMQVAGNRLSFTVVSQENDGQTVKTPMAVQVAGDTFAGTVKLRDGGADATLKGVRRRAWGEPLRLLADAGLAGWHARDGRKSFDWTCEGGVLTNKAGTVDIVSDRVFKDFKLHLEYMVDKGSNSGVYLRGRYEVQILDDFGRGVESHGNGAVYSRIPQKKNASREPNTWQTYDITLVGRYVTVVLNGETIIDNERLEGITGGALDPFEACPGPLMLQGDHGKVWYRNILVSPSVEAP